MYEVYDNILTIDEQNIITDILFDSNFPYYFINSSEQKSVSNLTYNELSDKNTVESKVMVHNFNHLKDKAIKRLENKNLFSREDMDSLFEELKRVPVKFSLKNQ